MKSKPVSLRSWILPPILRYSKPQKMTLPDGKPKGLQWVLEEHGVDVHKLHAKCSPVCPIKNQHCCLAHLSWQDDFKNQPSMLKTFIKGHGHECIFLPKFYCELNPIEMVSISLNLLVLLSYCSQYWGWCKYCYHEVDKKNFQDAKDAAKQYLEACPTEVIQQFINHSWRFMSVYRLGLTRHTAVWAVKKQKEDQQVS